MKNVMYLFFFSLIWLTSSVYAMELPLYKRKLDERTYLNPKYRNKKRKIEFIKTLNIPENIDTVVAEKLLKLDPFALHNATIRGQEGLMGLLLNYGVDINFKNENDKTPLHLAGMFGNIKVVEYLINHGADINAKNETGRTPLHNAVLRSSLIMVRILITKGASVNQQDEIGNSPLHIQALCYNHVDVNPELLCQTSVLSMRCDKTLKNNAGKTAIDLLPEGLEPEIYEMFESE